MKWNARNGLALSIMVFVTLTVSPIAVQAAWRIGDQRYYNDNKVCRDGMELGLADATQGDPPIIYKNIGATLYTTGFTPLPDVGDSSTFSPVSNFGKYISAPQDITVPQQASAFTLPDKTTTSVYITTTLRWSQPITPGLTIVMSRDNTVNGGGTNDGFFTTTVADCYLVAPPAITSQPTPITVSSGTRATLTVTASGDALTYQWYQGEAGDTSKSVGSNASAYTTPPLTTSTSYWVRVRNATASVDSGTITITVAPTASFKVYLPAVLR